MNHDTLTILRNLSISDKKDIAEKTLKATEEVGELARVVLARKGAASTTHRFADDQMVLEEIADVLMCAYSIAYQMGFDDEAIEYKVISKMEKWARLQANERKACFPVPFEIHVTVEANDLAKFKGICAMAGVKPIILWLQNHAGANVMKDVMTSSKLLGDNAQALAEARRVAGVFEEHGMKVLRQKIETVPWHPAAPQNDASRDGEVKMIPGQYFESHVGVYAREDQWEALSRVIRGHEAHLSSNSMKEPKDGVYKFMVTLRSSSDTAQAFQSKVDAMTKVMMEHGFEFDKPIVEFSIYDTRVKHDDAWITIS